MPSLEELQRGICDAICGGDDAQLSEVVAIQIAHGPDRFNLRQNGSRTLTIARDRHAFAASSVFSLSHAYHYDVRLSATAARDAKRVLEWPEFFFGFDFQNGE